MTKRSAARDEAGAPPRRFRRRGIAPALLLTQVENTARWALESDERASWRSILLEGPALEARWQERESAIAYLRVMLAAHFTTVATFVPTDVDAHIRHHIWQEIEDPDELARAIDVIDEAASWSPRPVSARYVEVPEVGDIAGHAGEWLSVRAGALGRALALSAFDLCERVIAAIDHELEREARALAHARETNDVVMSLCLSTISAHNCGDLSRVVEAWPRVPDMDKRQQLIERYARLGHERADRFAGEHHRAGHINKEVMASENHRFLALRTPRGLRRDRSLIVPIAPFLDRWGELVGSSPLLEEPDRGEVLAALLHGIDQSVDRWGYERAIAGIHRASPGGIDRLEPYVPARHRALIRKGGVRDALRLDEERFLARMRNAWKSALSSYRT